MNQTTVTGDRARRLPPWAGPWVRGTAGVVVFLLLAEAAGRLGIISRSALPLTSSVLARVVLLAGSTTFLADFGATVEAWAVGMAVTVAAGGPVRARVSARRSASGSPYPPAMRLTRSAASAAGIPAEVTNSGRPEDPRTTGTAWVAVRKRDLATPITGMPNSACACAPRPGRPPGSRSV